MKKFGRGLGDSSMAQMPQLEYAIKGTKQLSKLKKTNRLPITPRLLLLLKQYCHQRENMEIKTA